MSFPLFIARRIYSDKAKDRKVSRPAVQIATIGVAVGLAVMIVSVSVVFGFKHTIRDKVIGFGSHITVANFKSLHGSEQYPVCIPDSLFGSLAGIDGVSHVQRYALKQGLLKTDRDFLGVLFKGIACSEYDTTFIHHNIIEGSIPDFSSRKGSNKIVISKIIADKLGIHAGDRIYAYFMNDADVRARRFNVSGIYETNLAQFDNSVCFVDLYTAVRLNGWDSGQVSGAELTVENFDNLTAVEDVVIDNVNRTEDKYGEIFSSSTVQDMYPQIFSWLDLLDLNVWIILVLMLCVAGFTMISGLLIIILERTNMIGILKSLGCRNNTIRHIFIWFAVFIIGRGMLIGNVIGVGLIALQHFTGLIKLDPSTYYVSVVPVEFNAMFIIILNVVTLIASVFVLIAPSYIVSNIHPAKSMKYE